MSIERGDALWASCAVHTDVEVGPSFLVNNGFAPFGVGVTPVTSFQNGVGDYSMVLQAQIDPRSSTVFATLRSALNGTIVVERFPAGPTEDFELRVRTFDGVNEPADRDFDLFVLKPPTGG
jgi:hypothetical protein